MGLVRAIGNAVPAKAGYVLALPLLIAALEHSADGEEPSEPIRPVDDAIPQDAFQGETENLQQPIAISEDVPC